MAILISSVFFKYFLGFPMAVDRRKKENYVPLKKKRGERKRGKERSLEERKGVEKVGEEGGK